MICISKKIEIYHTIKLHHNLFFEKIVGYDMSIFDFHKMTNMHKGYVYQFFILLPFNLES